MPTLWQIKRRLLGSHHCASFALGALSLIGILASLTGTAIPPAHWQGPKPGGTWVSAPLTLQVNALLAEPGQAQGVLAGTTDGVWRSGDNGITWTRAGAELRGVAVYALAALPGGAALAGAGDGAIYMRATGAGQRRWQRVSPSLGSSPITSLAVSPDGPAPIVLAGAIGALYRGAGRGSQWRWRRVARTGEAAITAVAWAPWTTQVAFAAIFGSWPPVLTTTDAGKTWRPAVSGLPSALPTQALLGLPAPEPQIILTTMGDGVWWRGKSGPWHDLSAGLPGRHAMPLTALPGNSLPVLYAGTMGEGVYVKQGSAPWRLLGRGLTGIQNTIVALVVTQAPNPAVLAGTVNGVARYIVAPGSRP